jgi:outer membrane immunogenic protein
MKQTAWKTVAALAFAAVSSAAAAADLEVKAYPAANTDATAYPAPLSVLSWMSGFYAGGEFGGNAASQSATTNPFPVPGFGGLVPAAGCGGAPLSCFGNAPTTHNLNSTGLIGGGYAGYNWQATSNFLVGAEFHFDWLSRNSNDNETVLRAIALAGAAFNMLYTTNEDWLASVRGRVGWVWDRALLYVTGGPAWTRANYSATATGVAALLPGVVTSTSWSATATGYAVGAGGEWMLTRHWLVRAEYVHYGFNGSSANLPLTGTAAHPCAPGACNWALSSGRLSVETALAGVSYKFGPWN